MGFCIMRFGETFEGVVRKFTLLNFVRFYYLSLFIQRLIFLRRLERAQTTLTSSNAQRGVVPVLTRWQKISSNRGHARG